MTGGAERYLGRWRRALLDVHIPDWDDAFLTRYDPVAIAASYAAAGVTAAMVYAKSHAGLCLWPAPVGRMHAGLLSRDVFGELVAELRARDIAVCAYHSVVFENWAAENHPDWTQRSTRGHDYQDLVRYGWCCQSNPDYRAYELEQVTALLSRYDVDALFVDMIFWPVICACEHCRARYGTDVPALIDWTDPAWCAFQSARESWASELAGTLRETALRARPGIAYYHNLAPALAGWRYAQPIAGASHDTFAGGDLYGDRLEQLVISKLLVHLTENRPAEFMTSVAANLADHVRLKSVEQLRMSALAAAANGSAFLFIDAIEPSGAMDPSKYERIGAVFAETSRYEPYLGGEPVEDVAVYFSVASQMDFAHNGTPVEEAPLPSTDNPHLRGVRGACRGLQRAHVPFGVITRRQLPELSRFRVVVLPEVLRMDADELDAIREFVRSGGAVYASRHTSLVETNGTLHDDFMLADVLGCSYAGREPGQIVYLLPVDAEAIAPQRYLSCRATRPGDNDLRAMPRIALASGESLATLTLPYGYPAPGTVKDHRWASIHSSPPWEDTTIPVIVGSRFGAGRAIYSAAGIESDESEAGERLFVGLVRSLLGGHVSATADTHPAVWMSLFDQSDRLVVTLLNYQADLPPASVPVEFRVRAPAGAEFTRAYTAPDERPLPLRLDADGALSVRLESVEALAFVVAEYGGTLIATRT